VVLEPDRAAALAAARAYASRYLQLPNYVPTLHRCYVRLSRAARRPVAGSAGER
jgi:hypothetical protein